MIQEFVSLFEKKKAELQAKFEAKHPEEYTDIVRGVIELLSDEYALNYGDVPDPARIHVIDDGDYQGTILYVIADTGYQPNHYWAVKVYYGSCSGCDTLQFIRGYSEDVPTPEQVKDYMGLALNIVQGLKALQDS